jgi:hypothetical protein
MLHLRKSAVERQRLASAPRVVVALPKATDCDLLDGVQLEVLVPVTDSGFVAVGLAALQLLGGVLHI